MRSSYRVILSASNNLAFAYLRNFINTALLPIDYTRTKELPALLDVSGIFERKGEPLKVLDISSPQLLGLSLSLQSPNWDITYINPFLPELEDMRKRASVLRRDNLNILQADITRPETLEGLTGFDYVFSCSVFEHIHPEHGGDMIASANLGRLLKPGGLFVFSVPFYKKAFNEYVEGDAYSIKAASGQKTFFQRFYDEKTLQEQIIGPSGLRLFSKKFIGERFYHEDDITKRVAHKIGFGKMALLLGRFFSRLSDIFMTESADAAKLKKPYLAVYALQKTN
jgi:SAM-dependent methyltransferase